MNTYSIVFLRLCVCVRIIDRMEIYMMDERFLFSAAEVFTFKFLPDP